MEYSIEKETALAYMVFKVFFWVEKINPKGTNITTEMIIEKIRGFKHVNELDEFQEYPSESLKKKDAALIIEIQQNINVLLVKKGESNLFTKLQQDGKIKIVEDVINSFEELPEEVEDQFDFLPKKYYVAFYEKMHFYLFLTLVGLLPLGVGSFLFIISGSTQMSLLSFILLNCSGIIFLFFCKIIKDSIFKAVDSIEPYIRKGKYKITRGLRYFFTGLLPFIIAIAVSIIMMFVVTVIAPGRFVMYVPVNVLYVDIAQMVISAIFFFSLGLFFMYIGGAITMMLYIGDLEGKRVKLDLNMHHPDKMAGLSPFGNLSLRIILAWSIYLLVRSTWLFTAGPALVTLSEQVNNAIIVTVIFLILEIPMFVIPLSGLHSMLVHKKEEHNRWVSRRLKMFDDQYYKMTDDILFKTDIEKTKENVDLLISLRAELSGVQEWPFSSSVFIKAFSAIFIPLIIVLLEHWDVVVGIFG